MEGPAHNNELEKLFEKRDKDSLDDFEREALEGFDSLGSQEEAQELKAALDERIRSEVFSEKKRSPAIYWYAAAALLLIAGFSIYFLQHNDGILVPEKNMAFEQKRDAPPVPNSPGSGAQPQQQTEVAEKEGHAAANRSESFLETHQPLRPSDETAAGAEEASKLKTADIRAQETESRSDGKEKVTDDESGFKRSEAQPETKPVTTLADRFNASEIPSAPAEDKLAEKSAAPKSTSGPGKAERERQNQEAEPEMTKTLSKKSQHRKDQTKAAAGAPASEVAAKADKDENKQSGKELDMEIGKAETVTPASNNLAQKADAATGDNHAVYRTPDEATLKYLREQLVKESLNREFVALLKVKQNRKVKDVSLVAPAFNTAEQKRLVNLLKALKDFDLKGVSPVNGIYLLKINYKP